MYAIVSRVGWYFPEANAMSSRSASAASTSSSFLAGEMGFQLKDYLFSSGTFVGQVRGGNTSWAFGYTSYSFGSTKLPLNTVLPPASVNDRLQTFRSDHSGGANFLYADGSIHFIRNGIDPAVYLALGTRSGGEIITNDF